MRHVCCTMTRFGLSRHPPPPAPPGGGGMAGYWRCVCEKTSLSCSVRATPPPSPDLTQCCRQWTDPYTQLQLERGNAGVIQTKWRSIVEGVVICSWLYTDCWCGFKSLVLNDKRFNHSKVWCTFIFIDLQAAGDYYNYSVFIMFIFVKKKDILHYVLWSNTVHTLPYSVKSSYEIDISNLISSKIIS